MYVCNLQYIVYTVYCQYINIQSIMFTLNINVGEYVTIFTLHIDCKR